MSSDNNVQQTDAPQVAGALSLVEAPITQPRQPSSLQDLLRYSVEAGSQGAQNVNLAPMSQDSREFLEKALKSMTVNAIDELMASIKTLSEVDHLNEESNVKEHEAAFLRILDLVENIDIANDFHKVGGLSIIKPCLKCSNSTIRCSAAELVAELSQNNPYCQEHILKADILASLISMVDCDDCKLAKIKALYAISCLVRGYSEGFRQFKEKDGFSMLLRALQSSLLKLNIKSSFLLSSLLNEYPEIKDELMNMGYIQQLVGQLALLSSEQHSESTEHVLSALLSLVQGHQLSTNTCSVPELQLHSTLTNIIDAAKSKEEYKDEYDLAKKLEELVFADDGQTQEDR